MTFRAACMTPEESRLWEAAARGVRNGGLRPCVDCPASFAADMRLAQSCNGEPRTAPDPVPWSEKRRAYNREWMKPYRERRREHNAAWMREYRVRRKAIA